jgi:FixJ family two-component response regulator
MSGTELASCVRLHSEIPLIFISGEPAPANTSDSKSRFLFIEKPFGAKALLDAIGSCLELVPAAD